MNNKLWVRIRPVARPVLSVLLTSMFHMMRVLPIKKNKVVVNSYFGDVYHDNPRFIMEELHKLCPQADMVWVISKQGLYEVPEWVRTVVFYSPRWFYEYATARIWVDNCIVRDYFVKRKGQLYVETWHGGLGIKRIIGDSVGLVAKDLKSRHLRKNYTDKADVYISNSDHLSAIYRRAFRYHGPIWKCGYPKSDLLIKNDPEDGRMARKVLNIPEDNKVLLYAPTWRLRFERSRKIDISTYNLDMKRMKQALEQKFGGQWTMVIRLHQSLLPCHNGFQLSNPDIIDATHYHDMQRLLMATDVMVSDYSSCIFDAALRRIPCFTYATDFEQYKNEECGVYYEMEELPFPYAKNNDEMEQNVKTFDMEDYLKKWDAFTVRMGLNETGHAAKDIAEKMADFLDGKIVEWQNDYPITIPNKI